MPVLMEETVSSPTEPVRERPPLPPVLVMMLLDVDDPDDVRDKVDGTVSSSVALALVVTPLCCSSCALSRPVFSDPSFLVSIDCDSTVVVHVLLVLVLAVLSVALEL